MHSSELVRFEPVEEQGLYYERPVLITSILEDPISAGESLANSLDVLDAVVVLLRSQIQHRLRRSHNAMLSSIDIRRLYEAYTKLGFRLQLQLPPLRFRDWDDFEYGFADNPTELDWKIYWQRELDWFDEPMQIVRDAIETGWSTELFAAVDSSNRVGWPDVVVAMESLKRTFSSANGPEDYSKVALGAKRVLQRLSDSLWSEGKYAVPGDVEDGSERIKNRLHTVIVEEFRGRESDHLVSLMKAANDFTDQVRHKRNPSRYEAVVAADAALFLVNVLWLTYSNNRIDRD